LVQGIQWDQFLLSHQVFLVLRVDQFYPVFQGVLPNQNLLVDPCHLVVPLVQVVLLVLSTLAYPVNLAILFRLGIQAIQECLEFQFFLEVLKVQRVLPFLLPLDVQFLQELLEVQVDQFHPEHHSLQ